MCARHTQAYSARMETFVVPGVGRVEVEFEVRRFGLGTDTMKSVIRVCWPGGVDVSCEVHERTALHLEAVGVSN